MLTDQGARVSQVFFPVSGVLSVLACLKAGDMVEVLSVGPEGMTGIPEVWTGSELPVRLVVQTPGDAVIMSVDVFHSLFNGDADFAAAVRHYAGASHWLQAQSAACFRHHTVRQQCARWLATNHARLQSSQLPVTHEQLAEVLGVYRPTVSVALKELQNLGAITPGRGHINVADPELLEAEACECFASFRDHLLTAA